jgi:hypothetical protein
MADDSFGGIRPGVYDVDHFSGAQVAVFIGDILVDEITAINFIVQQQRRPLYGYGDQYFRAMSKGQILVQGQFAINFKEAGYLWLVLNEYRVKIKGKLSKLDQSPIKTSSLSLQQNVEQVINNEVEQDQRYEAIASLAEAYASLAGFASTTRAGGESVGTAENIFETFENYIWGSKTKSHDFNVSENRNADDPDLNPFDIFISYGDFTGDDRANHTIVKLEDCYIVGSSQRVEIDPLPIMEVYPFMGRMRV